MAFSKNEAKDAFNFAKTQGFNSNSNGTKMTNSTGSFIKPVGQSMLFNNTKYSSLSDLKKSKKW